MSPKRFALLLLAIISLAVLVSACDTTPSKRRPTPTPVPALVSYEKTVYPVQRGPIVAEKSASGELVPAKQDVLFFRSSGFIGRVTVKSGDVVKKGDILAELQVEDILNQLQQAKIDLEVAQSSLAQQWSQRQYAIEKAKIDLNVAQNRLELARIDVDNTRTSPAYDRALVNYRIAEQNVKLAELALKQASDLSGLKEAQVVDRQKLAIQRLEALLAERQITALYNGIVLRVMIQAGKQVNAFNPAIEIGDPTELVMRAQPDVQLRSLIDRDTEVQMSFSSQSKDIHRVNYLPDFVPFSSLESTQQQIFTQDWMYFSAPTDLPKSQLRVGTSVSLNIIIGRRENALLLPPAAIRTYRGLNFVIVQEGDRRRRVEIYKIGLQTNERWEVEADLKEGDLVIGQ